MNNAAEKTTDQLVAEYLTAADIEFAAFLMGETTRDTWTCDEWRVRFQKVHADNRRANGEPMETRFYTGTGHRKQTKHSREPRPVAPTAARVLYSLMQDASADGESFNDWCDNYGYNTDSRKALAMYLECQETAAKLARLFNREQRAELHTMLEDY